MNNQQGLQVLPNGSSLAGRWSLRNYPIVPAAVHFEVLRTGGTGLSRHRSFEQLSGLPGMIAQFWGRGGKPSTSKI
jgi:hypothetical protein